MGESEAKERPKTLEGKNEIRMGFYPKRNGKDRRGLPKAPEGELNIEGDSKTG